MLTSLLVAALAPAAALRVAPTAARMPVVQVSVGVWHAASSFLAGGEDRLLTALRAVCAGAPCDGRGHVRRG
jgi:hypothetical protein